MTRFTRRAALAAFSALALAACGAANGDDAQATSGTTSESVVLGAQKGNPDASVTVIEYASPTCPACKYFHDTVMPTIQSEYIDTGKINFIYREFPLNDIDVVAYTLARCAGEDKYFDVLDDLFASQDGIRSAARQGVIEPALAEIGKRHGVEDYNACKNNVEIRQAIADTYQTGEVYGISGTPTFIINEKVYKFEGPTRSAEGFSGLIDEQLEQTASE